MTIDISLKEVWKILNKKQKDNPVYYALQDEAYKKLPNKNVLRFYVHSIHTAMSKLEKRILGGD